MGVSLRAAVRRLRADFRVVDGAAYLLRLAEEDYPVAERHVALADLGVLRDPGPAVRRRASERPNSPPREPETPQEEVLAAAVQLASTEDLLLLFAADYWTYYRGECIAEYFGRPFGEQRLLAWTRERLNMPELKAAEAARVLDDRAREVWEALQERAGAQLAAERATVGDDGAHESGEHAEV